MAIEISGEMRELISSALADRLPCILGTASKDGEPQISMRGSVIVYGDDTLAYWERSKRLSMQNVGENPKVIIFYRNPEKRVNWRFHGTAHIEESGPVRDDVMSKTPQPELDRDPERQGVAVLVKLDRITDLSGRVLQEK